MKQRNKIKETRSKGRMLNVMPTPGSTSIPSCTNLYMKVKYDSGGSQRLLVLLESGEFKFPHSVSYLFPFMHL